MAQNKPSYVTDKVDAEEAAAALARRADGATDEQIAGLRAMGEELAACDAALAALAITGESITGRRRELAERLIPDTMTELRVPGIRLPSVTPAQWLADAAAKVRAAAVALENPTEELLASVKIPEEPELRVEDYCRANIAADWDAESRAAAFDWLEKSGNGGMIKVQLRALFGRGDKTLFDRAIKAFRKSLGKRADDVAVEVNESVPHGTLTAFVKAELDAGREVPLQTLGATVGKVAKLARPRRR